MNSVFGKVVYTGKAVLRNKWVVFDGHRIVGLSDSPRGDKAGAFEVITPAFIDPHCHIGMIRWGEPPFEDEANEQMESIVAVADALDSVQMDDDSLRQSVEAGVLYSCVMPGSGNIIGGRSAVIRNYAATTSQALIARAGVKSAFGYNPMSTRAWKGARPNTRMGAIAILRAKLHDVRNKINKLAKAKGKAKAEIVFSAEEEILRELLERKHVLRCHIHKTDDIAAALRLVDEFKLKITVEHACDVHDAGIYRQLKERGIPVIYGPGDSFAYKTELKHEDWRNLRHLLESGVRFGVMSDHPVILQRNVLLTMRWFIRLGMTKQAAIETLTLTNAAILGLDRQLGSLEKGKWASLVGWNGDPFDMTRYPTAVWGEGNLLYKE
ncbi:MAG: amidohydrolase family protein [Planctomycetes bacterium]|nr:amidohydrolase family protein [Planctomycetota bacterium]